MSWIVGQQRALYAPLFGARRMLSCSTSLYRGASYPPPSGFHQTKFLHRSYRCVTACGPCSAVDSCSLVILAGCAVSVGGRAASARRRFVGPTKTNYCCQTRSFSNTKINEDKIEIPVIDISNFFTKPPSDQRAIATRIDHAFQDYGFAVMTGHGTHPTVFEHCYRAAKQFFTCSSFEKAKFDLGLGYGYGGFVSNGESAGQLSGKKNSSKIPDAVESLTIRGVHLLSASEQNLAEAERSKCGGPLFAQDMSDVPVPDPVPEIGDSRDDSRINNRNGLKTSIMDLHQSLVGMQAVLLRCIEMALDMEPGFYLDNIVASSKAGIRFAYYPELDDSVKLNMPAAPATMEQEESTPLLGYGAHADSASMVFLRLDQENPEGTEVLHKATQRWIPMPLDKIPEDGVVVNLGTVLSLLTGGRWQAAVHRVVRRNHRERLSIVYGALVPRNGAILDGRRHRMEGTSLELSGKERAGKTSITVKEYLDARVRLQRPETDLADQALVDFIDRLTLEAGEKRLATADSM